MGASQSKSDTDEKVFYNETPIQFGQDVVHHLSDHLTSPETTPDRQTTLDAHIRSRIQADLQHLREQEEHVQHEIEIALEKENLEREKSMAGEVSAPNEDESTLARVKSSAALMGDLEEIRNKVDRFHSRQEFEGIRTVKEKGEAVVSCYRSHPTTTLDCWREVNEFKASVVHAEQEYYNSL
jgi:altered-inheritance-of-mitochondria protein 13